MGNQSSAAIRPNPQDNSGGSKTGGHGGGHSTRSYPNRVDDTGNDNMRGPGDRTEKH